MDWHEHIEQRPDVMLGQPVIKGTRLTVRQVLEDLADGATEQDLLDAYPRLRPEHIQAALAFAADLVPGGKGSMAGVPAAG